MELVNGSTHRSGKVFTSELANGSFSEKGTIMAKTGRPRVLDEVKQREVCALVSAGASVTQAAKYVSCSAARAK